MFSKLRAKVIKIVHIPEELCNPFFADSEQVKHLAQKDFFLKENEICRDLAFVNRGVLRMYYLTPNGKEINTQFFFENDFVVSYQSFLLQQPSRYFIEALSECELITIPHHALQKAFKEVHLWDKFGRIVAEKSFIIAEQRTESFLFYNSEERYLNLLKKQPKVFEQVPLYHIASYLGIERESLSRIRKKLSLSPARL